MNIDRKLVIYSAVAIILLIMVGRGVYLSKKDMSSPDLVYSPELPTPPPSGEEPPSPPSPRPASEFFSSGFEDVNIEGPIVSAFSTVHGIRGTDSKTGYTWPDDLPGFDFRPAHFRYNVLPDKNIDDYVKSRIESVVGPKGNITKTLYQEIKKNDPDTAPISRTNYMMWPDEGEDYKQLYIGYWIKLQPDLEDILNFDTWQWHMHMEWKEIDDTYRWNLQINRDGNNSPLFWKSTGQIGIPDGPVTKKWTRENVDWEIINKDVPVLLGKWFYLEVYWERDPSDGRVWVAIDGETIADHRGRTMLTNPIRGFSPFKVYTHDSTFANGPSYQWIDDVIMCTTFRCE
jgi:hypothetical protein